MTMVAAANDRLRSRGRDYRLRLKTHPQLRCAECGALGARERDERGDQRPDRIQWYANSGHEYGMAYGKWYCDTCWLKWFRAQQVVEPSRCPLRYEGKAFRRFDGQVAHVLQIGLGNFGTFLQQDAKWLSVLSGASSAAGCSRLLRGIGVDPVEECVGPLESLAVRENMAQASVLLAAVGERQGSGKLLCLPRGARAKVQRELKEKLCDHRTRAELDMHLVFMENMSCMEVLHTDFQRRMDYVWRAAGGLETPLMEERTIPIYTFHGILKLHEASGCEVLIVDAEGCDVAVMRSVMQACSSNLTPWPRVIRFETMGHANQRVADGEDAEEGMVKQLQEEAGYLLLYVCNDVTLVHGPSLKALPELARWADTNFAVRCCKCTWWLLPSHPSFSSEGGSGYSQWRGAPGAEFMGAWSCRACLQREERRKEEVEAARAQPPTSTTSPPSV